MPVTKVVPPVGKLGINLLEAEDLVLQDSLPTKRVAVRVRRGRVSVDHSDCVSVRLRVLKA